MQSSHAPTPLQHTPTANKDSNVLQILSRPQTQVVAAARPSDDCDELHALLTSHKNRMMIVPLELSDPDTVLVCFDFASRSRAGSQELIMVGAHKVHFQCRRRRTLCGKRILQA